MGKQHIIELNGKRYDSVTGKMIDNPLAKAPAPIAIPLSSNKGLDGFVLPKSARQINSPPAVKTQRSKTLMRGTVHKPTMQKITNPTSPTQRSVQQIQTFSSISISKLAHASKVPKNALIRRFGIDTITRPPGSKNLGKSSPTKIARLQATATAVAQSNILERGLADARSHEQTTIKKPRRHTRLATRLHVSPRVLNGSTLALATLLIIGFFGYQNIPNLNMRLATTRSGVHGNLPGFQPAGFTLERGITYKPGQIIIGYRSNSDDRSFKITQDNSAWNSETLADNFFGGADCSARCQIIQDRGKTVYLYDGNNATWVDGGIWYRVEGNSRLNSDQLLNIAASL